MEGFTVGLDGAGSHKGAGVLGHGGPPEPLFNEIEGVGEAGMTGNL